MIPVRLTIVCALLLALVPCHADDLSWLNPEHLPPQLKHPLKLLATTRMSGEGQDYFSLQPGATATIGTISGPAIIFRVWSTSSDIKKTTLDMIVDGKKETLYAKGVMPVGVLKDDPLRAMDKQAYWSYVPVVVEQQAVFKARSFEVSKTAEPIKFYLQAGYRQVTVGELRDGEGMTASRLRSWAQALVEDPLYSLAKPVKQNGGARPTRPMVFQQAEGQYQGDVAIVRHEAVLTAQTPAVFPLGPSMLRAMIVDVDATATPQQLQATRIIVTCDGQKTMDVPLASLFGVRSKLTSSYESAPLAVQGTRLILRYPMFIADRLQVALGSFVGQGLSSVKLEIQFHGLKSAPKYRLCAQYFSQVSVADQPMTLLNVTGEGIFVGTNMSVNGLERRTFAFLEGNEQIYIDGDTKPTMEGTGTEDYFNGAWYFEAGEKTHLFHGVTFKQDREPPSVDCYRHMISDCIPFKQSFRFDLQHGSRNRAPNVLYEGVMFWYQSSPTNVAEPVAAKLPVEGAAEGEPAGWQSHLVVIVGFVMALVVVGLVAWRVLRRKA